MMKTIQRTILMFVGGHLFLGVALLVIDAIHGINDQDASFAVALLFYYLNLPTYWALKSTGATPEIATVLVLGVVQWTVLGLAISIVFSMARHKFRAIPDQATKTTIEPKGSDNT